MLRFINTSRAAWRNQVLKFCSLRSGQVAVVMIVAIAIGLILFAASINLTMMAQSKTLTMKAASASAAGTASFIASYGQKEYVETMGRRLRYCKSSGGGFWSLLTLIVMIVVAIFAPYIAPALGMSSYVGLQAAAIVGAVMEAASIVIAASIDPGISDMWNRMQNANLSMTGQVVERGVQTAMQAAVTDQVKIPDLYDMDGDGLFGYPAGSDQTKDPPNDTIGRFSYYNTKRYLSLKAPATKEVKEFVEDLHNLVLKDKDDWGLWDPVYYPNFETKASGHDLNHPCYISPTDPVAYVNRPAECDYCCDNYNTAESPLPKECVPGSGALQAGIRSTCAARSPFRSPDNLYPYVYDFSYEDSTNTFMSFREQLGRDDEHHLYHAGATNPNWHSNPRVAPQSRVDTGFFLKDVVGYYQNPPFTLATPDIWIASGTSIPPTPAPKLFPFFYKMQDWGPDLGKLEYKNYECHWCDKKGLVAPCPDDMSSYPEIPNLILPFDPSKPGPLSGKLLYNKSWCVNKVNSGSVKDPPLLADVVSGTPNLFVANNECAINPNPTPTSDLNQYVPGWKHGADRYCSNKAGTLYSLDCPKHGAVSVDENPQCGQAGAAGPTNWPDDMIDEIIYGLPALFDVERNLWQAYKGGAGAGILASTFMEWYGNVNVDQNGNQETIADGVADWIEPPCPNPDKCPGSFTKLARPGTLWIWRAELQWLNKQIQAWLVPTGRENRYSGKTLFGSGAAWCIPPTDLFAFPGISQSPDQNVPLTEQETFDFNKNGVRGDVADVIACLKWNYENTYVYSDAAVLPATGNAAKFWRCSDQCGAETCTNNLPRSLVPAFYTLPPFKSYPGDEAKFQQCLTSDTIVACQDHCKNSDLPSGGPYASLPAFKEPNAIKIANINTWCSGPNKLNPRTDTCNGSKMTGGVTTLTCVTNQQACICSWAQDCAGITNECAAYCSNSGKCDYNYRDKVTDQIIPSRGSCADANWPNFKSILLQSADEAEIQSAKFKKRADFLQARYDEAMALSNDKLNPLLDSTKPDGILTVAIKKITEFLDNDTADNFTDSPAEKLIQARINNVAAVTGDLPSFGLYVWQDEDPVKPNPDGGARWDDGQGYWHAVKVEVRIPRRCGSGSCITNEWPKVFSKTSGGGFLKKTKICYTLINRDGRTKARVIRYDQDKDLRGLVFPGGKAIWQARMSHPQTGTPDPTGIRGTCESLIDPDLDKWINSGDTDVRHKLGAAFMFNEVPDLKSGNSYAKCWQKVHEGLLSHGIQSEACAEYYAIQPQGFQVKFVPCDNW